MNGLFEYDVAPRQRSQGSYTTISKPPDSSSSAPGAGPTGPPGLSAFNMASYSQNRIPGLTFGAASDGNGWGSNKALAPQVSPPTTEQQPAQPSLPGIGVAPLERIDSSQDLAEEGELTEAVFEDLYEPYEEPGDARPTRHSQHISNEEEEEEYLPPEANKLQSMERAASPPGRDRSRSYSPYLSPGEVHNSSSVETRETGKNSQGPPLAIDGDQAPQNQSTTQPQDSPAGYQSVAELRKKAQSAILRLWSLNVRFQDYIDEGVDENIVRNLFDTLGLDTKPNKASQDQQSVAQNKAPAPPPPIAAPIRSQTMPEAGSSQAEERKDRIARLLAAKAAKPTQPTAVVSSSASKPPSDTSASTASAPRAASKPPMTEEQARAKAEKERLLQQKLEALQKSRAARAQKASDKPSVQSEQPASEHTAGPPSITSLPPKPVAASSEPASIIPGLSLPSNPSAQPTITRKRPVAAELNEAPPVPYKRPFGHQRNESSLIIDVSDESDEDVDMDLGSPQDVRSPGAQSVSQSRTASFRNHPPLSDRRGPRQFSSPAPQSGAPPPTQPPSDPAKLDLLHQGINEMKRKIAEAERRKVIAKQSAAQSPAATSSAGDSGQEKPELRRATSMGSLGPSGRDAVSPPVPANDTQRKLPKPSQLRASSGGEDTQSHRFRIVSEALPTLAANLMGKRAKLRLLMSEEARLQKEIDDMESEKAVLEREAEDLAANRAGSVSSEDNHEHPGEISSLMGGGIDGSAPQSMVGVEQEEDRHLDEHQSNEEEVISNNDDSGNAEPQIDNDLTSGAAGAEFPGETKEPSLGAEPPSEDETGEVISEQDTAMADDQDESTTTSPAGSDGRADDAEESHAMAAVDDASAGVPENRDGKDISGEPLSDKNGQQPLGAPVDDPGLVTQGGASSVEPIVADLQVSMSPRPVLGQISNGDHDAADQGPDTEGELELSLQPSPSISHFSPYESVLKDFVSYRFHPNFEAEVAGGLRSLTYSNKIDPHTPMCPESLLGEECPRGAQCPWQHMESIVLPDSEIILQLGDARRLSGDDHQRYINGLRIVLSQLKGPQSKDFGILSRAIIDYRAQFFGDKYRILPLGDVKI